MRENHDTFEFPFSYKIIMILLKLEKNLMKILLFYHHNQKKRGYLWQNSFDLAFALYDPFRDRFASTGILWVFYGYSTGILWVLSQAV
jgi:hypothetical protein